MKLNDDKLIQQAKNTHASEIEVMYWIVEDSVHKGKNDLAKGMLIHLLYAAKYNPVLIQKGLKQDFKNRLKILSHSLLDGKTYKKQSAITIRSEAKSKKIPFKLELELKEYLIENKSILEDALQDKLRIVGTEVNTEDDYKCDIVAEGSDIFYPIELKINQGTHAVVSQCSKYCYYFYRQLRYHRFKKVQGVIIGNGYDKWSINELRREGHWIYTILEDGKNIKLEKIQDS